MKVLTSPAGSVLVFNPDCTASFAALDGTIHDKGVVADIPDRDVAVQVRAALINAKRLTAQAEEVVVRTDADGTEVKMVAWDAGGVFGHVEQKDLRRDLKFITLCVTDVGVGAEVGVIAKGRSLALDIPQSARPNYQAGLAVGSKVAVGPNVSPKAFINARGTVVAINGVRATVEFDAGDIDRVNRATGKNFGVQTKMHKTTLEVI